MTLRRRARRGGILLEFALILPLALAVITFSIDMGRVVLARTGLHDAVSVAARTGARTGNPGVIPAGEPCLTAPAASEAAYSSFCTAVTGLPGVHPTSVKLAAPTGGVCDRDADQLFVTVSAEADITYLTPGLRQLIGLASKGTIVRATATARCEVAR